MRRIALISLLAAGSWIPTTPGIAQENGQEDGQEDGREDAQESAPEDGGPEETAEEEDDDTGVAEGNGGAGSENERLSSAPGSGTPSDPPKVAVVTVGDPDQALREHARHVDDVLSRAESLTTPADSGLRSALRGAPAPDEDDGLGRVRRERRGLGIDDNHDAEGLSALGRVTGSVAVVVMRRRSGTIEATVLDVASGQLYEAELDLADASDEAIMRFITPRAEASALRAAERAAQSERRDWRAGAASVRDGRDAAARQSADESASEEDEEEEEEPGFFAKWWPYMVGALLLAGALVYAFTIDTTPDTPPPVLRFIPGGN